MISEVEINQGFLDFKVYTIIKDIIAAKYVSRVVIMNIQFNSPIIARAPSVGGLNVGQEEPIALISPKIAAIISVIVRFRIFCCILLLNFFPR
jgi:hypothetical protein